MTLPNASLVFYHASTPVPPPETPAKCTLAEVGMTITVENTSPKQALEHAEFIKEALEFAGTTGAEHAAIRLVAAEEKLGSYASIRVEKVPAAFRLEHNG